MPRTLAPQVTISGAVVGSTIARMLEAVAGSLARSGHVTNFVPAPTPLALASLDPASTVIVPSGDSAFGDAAQRSGARVVRVGFDSAAEIRADGLTARSNGSTFVLHFDGTRHSVRLSLLGEQLAEDALVAIGAAVCAGVPVEDAIGAVEAIAVLAPRIMEPMRTVEGALVIDDSHDMAPQSVVDALKALAMFGTEGRRTTAVLGELTIEADAEQRREAHDRIGRIVVRLNIARLIVVGDAARHIHNAAGLEGSWNGESVLVDTADEAYDRLREDLGADEAVLVKVTSEADGSAELITRLRAQDSGVAQ